MNHDISTSSSARRDFSAGLESLRGIAAIAVAVFHCISPIRIHGDTIFNKTLWNLHGWDETALRLSTAIFSGSAPVSLFFVLSGFVLYQSLDRARGRFFARMKNFVVQRFFRIYPAMAINLLCMSALLAIAQRSQGFFPPWYVPPQGFMDLWSNLLLLTPAVNGATWTLKIEIEAIPFIFFGYYILQFGRVASLVLVIASCALVFAISASENSIMGFLFMFYFGMVAEYVMQNSKMKSSALGVTIAACIIFFSRAVLGSDSRFAVILEALGCTYLIASVATGDSFLNQLLNTQILRFCGKTSYSFYLYHPLVLPLLGFGVVYRLIPEADIVSAPVLVLLTVAATFPVAWIGFRYVEVPFQRLGKAIQLRVEPSIKQIQALPGGVIDRRQDGRPLESVSITATSDQRRF